MRTSLPCAQLRDPCTQACRVLSSLTMRNSGTLASAPCPEVLHQVGGGGDGGKDDAAHGEAGDDAARLQARPRRKDENGQLACISSTR